jgi:P4 family phage/plasmid primase-like protien
MKQSQLNNSESQIQKINLFKNLFRGRDDCYGEGKGLCTKEPVSDAVIKSHLSGSKRIGIYMLTGDSKDTVYFAVMDFDNDEKDQNPASRLGDALEYYNSCQSYGLNAYIEASKTAGCYHVWHFFSEPVSALKVRRLMMQIVSDTNIQRYEIFPKQDKTETYGNYINLPLFKTNLPANTAFIDNASQPIKDQWEFLKSIIQNTPESVDNIIEINGIDLSNNGHKPVGENQEKWITEAMKGAGLGNRTTTLVRLISYYATKKIPKDIILATMLLWDANNKPMLAETYGNNKIPDTVNDILNRYYNGDVITNEIAAPVEKPINSVTEKPYKAFFVTDYGNAERLVYRHGENIRYCEPMKSWFIWDGKRWKCDDCLEIERLAKDTIRRIYTEAGQCENDNQRKAVANHARNSEANNKIQAMITLTKSESAIMVNPDSWNSDSFLLNCNNGTINLRTGKLLPHRKTDNLTKLIPVNYDPEAECPRWELFLKEIFMGDKDLITFIKYAVGYSLTGSIKEECIFICYGTGRNGKSKLLDTIEFLMGDYGRNVDPSTFEESRKFSGSASEDIARLKDARFISTIETAEGRKMAEGLIKKMTGDRIITARELYKSSIQFEQKYKLWIATNHKPIIKGTDNAIWERIKLIPFEMYFSEEKRDKDLLQKLIAEAPGILNWAIEGCLNWQSGGLYPVSSGRVKEATDKYRNEMDLLGEFVEEKCIQNPSATVSKQLIYNTYLDWCKDSGIQYPESKIRFGRRLKDSYKASDDGDPVQDNVRIWKGIKLNELC